MRFILVILLVSCPKCVQPPNDSDSETVSHISTWTTTSDCETRWPIACDDANTPYNTYLCDTCGLAWYYSRMGDCEYTNYPCYCITPNGRSIDHSIAGCECEVGTDTGCQ